MLQVSASLTNEQSCVPYTRPLTPTPFLDTALSAPLLAADTTVSTRPKRSSSAVHASIYLSEPAVNFAKQDFALPSTASVSQI